MSDVLVNVLQRKAGNYGVPKNSKFTLENRPFQKESSFQTTVFQGLLLLVLGSIASKTKCFSVKGASDYMCLYSNAHLKMVSG